MKATLKLPHFSNKARLFIALGAMLCVLFLRRPDAFLTPQFYAEDGLVFFAGALCEGFSSLWMPYAGYYHAAPRLVALLANLFHITAGPSVYLASCLLSLLILVIYLFSDRINLKGKVLIAILSVLAPIDTEVLLNITNMQWHLSLLLLLILIAQAPVTVLQKGIDLAMLVLCGLTGPFSLIFLPIAFARVWSFRDRYSALLLGILSTCGAIQFSALLAGSALSGIPVHTFHEFISVLSQILFKAFFFYSPLAANEVITLSWSALFIALLSFTIFKERSFPHRVLFLTIILSLASSYQRIITAPTPVFGTGRYLFLCIIPLSWLLIDLSFRSRLAFIHTSGLAISLLFFNPDFSFSLADYHWSRRSSCIGRPGGCAIKIPPRWVIRLYQVPKGSEVEVPEKFLNSYRRCEISP